MALPHTSTLPSSARSAPTRQRSRVDLPAPLRPVSAIASPVRTSRLNFSKMVLGPKARRRPETLRIVARLAMEAILPLFGKRSFPISWAGGDESLPRGHGPPRPCDPEGGDDDDDLDHQPRVAYRVPQPAASSVRASIS